MTHLSLLLCAMLTSSLLLLNRTASAETSVLSVLCSWTKVLPNGEVHLIYVRQSSPSPSPSPSPSVRLYHSAWSSASLLSCSWSDDAAVIHNYLSLCREQTHHFSSDHALNGNLDVESMLEAEELCVSVASPEEKTPVRSVQAEGQAERSEVKRSHRRVKRGFIVPGTLWCGSGNKAPSYEDLGVFSDTDSCCREHDQCKDTILSFHSGFGVFNSNIFTMSHCDCDNKFHRCLMEANDSISGVVGYTFFNLLSMHCFEFSHRLQCTERNWFGMCKETKLALYAEVHPPTLFDAPNPTEVSSIINTTSVPTELLGSNTSDSITAAASTVPTPSTSSPSASITSVTKVTNVINVTNVSNVTNVTNVSNVTNVTNVTNVINVTSVTNVTNVTSVTNVTNVTSVTNVTNVTASTSEAPAGPAPGRRDDLENTLPVKKQPLSELDVTENQLSCAVYKDLDECKDKILPQQKRYGLHNPESTMLYHCNCTSRLFQTLAKQRQLTEVHTLLLGQVSQSCFLPQDCTAGNICTAVLVRAEFPQLDQRSRADVEERRHLQAVTLKVRRPNLKRAKRKDRAVRLHKLCLRMLRRPKLNQNRTRTTAQRPTIRGTENSSE